MSGPSGWWRRSLPGSSYGERVRWLFLLLAVLNAGAVLPLALTAEVDPRLRGGAAAGVAFLCWAWVRGYRRRRFPQALLPAEGLAAFLACVGAGDPNGALGIIYCAPFLYGLYASAAGMAAMSLTYLGAYLAAVQVASWSAALPYGLLAGPVLVELLAFPVVVVVARLLGATLTAHESTLARERELGLALRRSEQRFRSLVHNAADVIIVVDAGGVILEASPAVERVLGYRAEDRPGTSVLNDVHPDDLSSARDRFAAVLTDPGAPHTAELRVRRADGSYAVIEGSARNLLTDPAVRGFVINYRDVSDRKALEAQLRHQALHDPLTGLANRVLFLERLTHACAARPWPDQAAGAPADASLAVLLIDLDDFKTVNDTAGHHAGDQLLATAAGRLRGAARAGDTVARLGGDEFAVLAHDLPEVAEAERLARRLLEALRADQPDNPALSPVLAALDSAGVVDGGGSAWASGGPGVPATVGIALGAPGWQDAHELLRRADVAMYAAKRGGKNRWAVYQPSGSPDPAAELVASLPDRPVLALVSTDSGPDQ